MSKHQGHTYVMLIKVDQEKDVSSAIPAANILFTVGIVLLKLPKLIHSKDQTCNLYMGD